MYFADNSMRFFVSVILKLEAVLEQYLMVAQPLTKFVLAFSPLICHLSVYILLKIIYIFSPTFMGFFSSIFFSYSQHYTQ